MISSPCIATVLLLAVFACCLPASADVYPGDVEFDRICREIILKTSQDSIQFWQLKKVCKGWFSGCSYELQIREIVTQAAVCKVLTLQHNTNNAKYLGGVTVSVSQCVSALKMPALYGANSWNMWAGRHCGVWTSSNSQTFVDNALWNAAQSGNGYVRQNVRFETRTCCNEGWNASGGKVIASCMQDLQSIKK